MRSGWVKMRLGLNQSAEVMQIADSVKRDIGEIVVALYVTACWFKEHGKYGVLSCPLQLVDRVVAIDGFAESLMDVDWLRYESGAMVLRVFTSVSATRKALGREVRRQVLASGQCVVCGSSSELQIDHIVPICRGGSSDPSNLQCLCRRCNSDKGKRTMEEYLRDRRP